MTAIRPLIFLTICAGAGAWLLPHPVQSHHTQPFASADSSQAGHHHNHPPLEISANQTPPTVDLVVHPDSVKGWNLEIQVTHFEFAPTRVNTPSTNTAEGHAHLFVNGQKITRLYGNWYYLSELPPGSNTLEVTLNGNGHEALVYQGQPISATAVIQVPPQP